jgi:hypothetical protein
MEEENEDVYQVGSLMFFKPDDPKFNTLGECVKYVNSSPKNEVITYGIWGVGFDQGFELVAIIHEGQYFRPF